VAAIAEIFGTNTWYSSFHWYFELKCSNFNLRFELYYRGACWPRSQCTQWANAEVKQFWLVIGWVTENLLPLAPSYFGRHVKQLVPSRVTCIRINPKCCGANCILASAHVSHWAFWNQYFKQIYLNNLGGARWPRGQCTQRANAEVKQCWPIIGWATENLLPRVPSCFGRHVKQLVPANSNSSSWSIRTWPSLWFIARSLYV
jgi:hypothetical protein